MGKVVIALGVHAANNNTTDWNGIYSGLEQNDTSTSLWEPAVTDGLIKHEPEVIVSDGLQSRHPFGSPSSLRDRLTVRAYMPPNLPELLDRDITLIGGDSILGSEFVKELPSGEKYNRTAGEVWAFSGNCATVAAVFSGLHGLVALDKRMNNKAASYAGPPSTDPLLRPIGLSHDPTVDISRRKFLSWGAGACIGLTVSQIADRYKWATNDASLPRAEWLAGRSALMIQKALEVSEDIDAVVGVVMGNGHSAYSEEFLTNSTLRAGYITKLVDLLIRMYIDTNDLYHGLSRMDRIDLVRQTIGQYSMFTVGPFTTSDVFYEGTQSSTFCAEIADSLLGA